MPTTTTDEEPTRWGKVLIPTPVAEPACRPTRVSCIHRKNSTATASSTAHGNTVQATMLRITTRAKAKPRRNDFMGLPPLAPGQRVDDVQAHGAQRGQHADQQ